MVPEGSLPCSQPSIGPYLKPDKFSPYYFTLFVSDPFYYYSSTYVRVPGYTARGPGSRFSEK
jgi:hypothetical protein